MATRHKVSWPTFVEIGGERVSVRFADLEGDSGRYYPEEKIIEISVGMSFVDTLNTLRHEMMEAALFIAGTAYSTHYDQEPIVRCMENLYLPAQDRLLARMGLLKPLV
jgi:hypothetical protein